jgi:hypothetical protein
MHRRPLVVLATVLVLASVAASACTAAGPGTGSAGPASPVASGATDSGDLGLPPEVIDPIVADAVARTGLPPDLLVIQTAEPRTYGDGSLDCPEPGMMYTQAIVEGYQVVIASGEGTLDYRGSAPGVFKLCTA